MKVFKSYRWKQFIDKLTGKKEKQDYEINIISSIGYFYFFKNKKEVKRELFEAAYKEIKELGITDIKFFKRRKVVEITLSRPGVLIGVKGKNIKELEEWISKNISMDIKIFIKEEKKLQYLYNFAFCLRHDEF